MVLLWEIALISGLVQGSIYALLGLGMTLIFGVVRILNLAHGDFLILSGYLTFWLFFLFGLDPFLSILIVAPILFCIGFALQKFVINYAIRNVEFQVQSSVLVTYGIALLISNSELLAWGGSSRYIHLSYALVEVGPAGLSLTIPRVIAVVAAFITTILVVLLLRTELGKKIRACVQNREVAMLMGINYKRIMIITFAIATAIAGISGAIWTTSFVVYPAGGLVLTLKGFIVAVMGGLASPIGTLVAGLSLGIIESTTSVYVTTALKDAMSFLVLLVILLVRPTGIFGRRISEV